MRHAVSVASVNAAAVRAAPSPECAHVRRRHHDVVGQRPRDDVRRGCRTRRHSGWSPARQYSHVRSLMPGIDQHVVADATRRSRRRRRRRSTPHASAPRIHGGTMRDAGQPVDDEQIEMVERGGAHAHAHVASDAERRHRQVVAQLDAIESAVRGDRECSHAKSPAVILRSRSVQRGAVERRRRIALGVVLSSSPSDVNRSTA